MHILRSYSTTAERFIKISSPFKEKLPLQERCTDRQTDAQGDSYTPKKTLFERGIIIQSENWRGILILMPCLKQDLSDSDSFKACI